MKVFYFGCWGEPGHYLFNPNKQTLHRYNKADIELCPFTADILDVSLLLPFPEKKNTGTIHHVRNWTIMAWWGSPWDNRGNTNTAILIDGKLEGEDLDVKIWLLFKTVFPQLASKITPPEIIYRP